MDVRKPWVSWVENLWSKVMILPFIKPEAGIETFDHSTCKQILGTKISEDSFYIPLTSHKLAPTECEASNSWTHRIQYTVWAKPRAMTPWAKSTEAWHDELRLKGT